MISIKITPRGGYVLGDGPCPFDPDQFLIMFGAKVIEAQRQGLETLMISDDEIDRIMANAKQEWADEVMAAPVKRIPNRLGKSAQKLLEQV